jgi:hypothetical protein
MVSFDGWSSHARAWRAANIRASVQRDTVNCGNFPEETSMIPFLPEIALSIFAAGFDDVTTFCASRGSPNISVGGRSCKNLNATRNLATKLQ